MRAKLQWRIHMVIKIVGKPSVFFSLFTRHISNSHHIKANLLFQTKPSNSALALTLGRIARVLDWAYPPNSFRRRGEWLTMVVVVGGCVVLQKTRKNVLVLRVNSTER